VKFFHKILLVITLLLLGHATVKAQGFTPESGFWWNLDEPGSGYAIEIQDNFLFVALYVYDEFGNPIWYTAGASLTGQGGNSFFDTELNFTFNGTCIDCSYIPPTTIIGERGPITIDFLTETTATIQFQGAIKNIERFNFILGDELAKMRGEWQIITDPTNIFPGDPFFADVIIFNQLEVFDGIDLVTGCRSESTLFNNCTSFANLSDVAASYDFDAGVLDVVVNHTDTQYLLYRIRTGIDQFDGDAYVYAKGTTPNINVSGFLVRGFRSASRTFVETGQGPSKNSKITNDSRKRIIPNLHLSKTIEASEIETKNVQQYATIKRLEEILEKKKTSK